MNSKRAANRRQANHIAHREPEHHEQNFRRSMSDHQSHGSPASVGARIGSGERPGAGELELPANGPGAAAGGYAGMPKDAYPSNKPPTDTPKPKGMRTYDQE